MYEVLLHRGLDASTFAASLAQSGDFRELFVQYESPAGKARCQRLRDKFGVMTYNVSFNGSVLATARSTLTLSQLDTLVGFTSEPPTLADEVADLETRVAALEA